MTILAQGPELGLDSLVQPNLLDPRAAAERSQSVFYEYGLISTPWGFAKFDLTTGLNSGDSVLAVFPYREIDGFDHILAATTQKIFDHDAINEEWDDVTQSGLTMQSAIDTPVSRATVGHDDSDIFLNDDSAQAKAFYHIVVNNGGLGNIQRWAGRREADFADLTMSAGDYGGATQTTHRAGQVSMSQQNRMLLISPQEFNSSTNLWTENNQMIRWPQIGKLQSWSGTGSGFVNLQDTGGLNVWSASLGAQHIIYQTRGIWTLNHVGGTTVFSPTPVIPDLGLLAPHLLVSFDNVHYFIGTDLNVHAYFGGSVKQTIGDPIHRFLQADLDKQYKNRMWMAMGPDKRRLWIFIVEQGSIYITKAYYRNMQTGAWGVRDLKNKFNTTTGITAVSLVGGQTITTGESYAEALDILSGFPADISEGTAGDVTQRYGDVLSDTTMNRVDVSDIASPCLDFTDMDFSKAAGGLEFDYSSNADNTVILADPTTLYKDWSTTSKLVMRIDDGSDTVGMAHGTHFYQLTDVCSVNNAGDWSITIHLMPRGTGFATSVCSGGNVEQFAGDTSGLFFDPSDGRYRDVIQEIETQAQLVLGDATGLVYQMDETFTDDDGSPIDARHYTPVFDLGQIGLKKRWKGVRVVAEGTAGGAMFVRQRISQFDTSDTGFIDFSFDLTAEMREKTFYTNVTSKRIQYLFDDFSGKQFKVREFEVLDPQLQDNR